MDNEPELTVEEVAALLRVHPETVRNWLRAGRFPHARRLSRRAGWRVPRKDVDALGRERTEQ
jgi:excisionase family DNA binding protein